MCDCNDDIVPQQDRTGRIIFKLFDKDPSHLPGTLRTQVLSLLFLLVVLLTLQRLYIGTFDELACHLFIFFSLSFHLLYFFCSFSFQIYNWLSNSPSEMESYIRPGCVVLSIYVSMPSTAWDKVSGGLQYR